MAEKSIAIIESFALPALSDLFLRGDSRLSGNWNAPAGRSPDDKKRLPANNNVHNATPDRGWMPWHVR